LDGDRPLARSLAARRIAARSVLEIGRDLELLGFGLADTHVHVLTAALPDVAAELARRIKIGLQRALDLGAPFHPTRVRTIEDAWHLHRAIPYVVGQPTRHAPGIDPDLEGTSLPELLGLRVVDGGRLARAVFALAPRLDRVALEAMLGVGTPVPFEPDWSLLSDAAAAAFAVPHLASRADLAVRARRAAIHAAAHLSNGEIAALLDVGVSCVKEGKRAVTSPIEVEAVRAQLHVRSARARCEHLATRVDDVDQT
jgi:hypothetical protein